VETGAVSVGRLQALMDAKRDAEFEAEISLFEDHNADIPDPILSAQITQLFRWRNQAISLIEVGPTRVNECNRDFTSTTIRPTGRSAHAL
jgi:hypothetical protein